MSSSLLIGFRWLEMLVVELSVLLFRFKAMNLGQDDFCM
ncbi:hypothetical protein DSUL_50122 [Desulfovibrionales bacterium]